MHAQALFATSGKDRVQLLELYSSEGCSSCPPADTWVSELKNKTNLWKTFVPVAFHVDYWNQLGWKDEFSSPSMTQRQIDIAHLWGGSNVYTPAMVVDGNEWRDWRSANNHLLPTPQGSSGIILSLFKKKDGSFKVKVEGQKRNQKYIVHFAQLGMDLVSEVKKGENAGKSLTHNFVVLHWQNRLAIGTNIEESFKLVAPKKKGSVSAIAAWIEEEGKQSPLQAAGGYL